MKGSTTSVVLSLLDAHKNAVASDLFSVELSVENGYILDNSGNPQKNLSLDIFDSSLAFTVQSDKVGEMKIRAKINGISTEKKLQIYEEMNLRVQIQTPQVGGLPRDMKILMVDNAGNKVENFSSIVSLSLPKNAGDFSKEIIEIKNGESEIIQYYPGTVAGIHNLTLSIPGLGTFDKNPLTLLAGEPMYLESIEVNGRIVISIKDRYGNVTNFSGKGFLQFGTEDIKEIDIVDGKYTLPKRAGKYILEVPDLANKNISYNENGQVYTISAISKMAFEITLKDGEFQFNNDYKAQYTVLAGGSFLRE